MSNVTTKRARIYDGLALLVALLVVSLDQWTKALVVEHLGPPDLGPQVPILGQYLVLFYIQNNGAAFSLLANNIVLIVLIAFALAVIVYLYVRMWNTGSLATRLIFGLIAGGALGNLIDRVRHGNYVIDFISFRIPQIGFYFAIFNLADAAISVGVIALFLMLLFGSFRRSPAVTNDGGGGKQAADAQADEQAEKRSTESQAEGRPRL